MAAPFSNLAMLLFYVVYIVLRTALAIQDSEEPCIIYLSDSRIEVFSPSQDHSQIVLDNAGNVTDLAFGPNRTLFWTDMYEQMVFVLQFDENYKSDIEEIIIDTGLVSPNGLAVDWTADILYIVDTRPGEIIVCSLKGDNCAILLQGLINPHSIAIDSYNRTMFWSAWGEMVLGGGIYQSGTDGSLTSALVQGINHPTGLVLDTSTRALFWLCNPHSDDLFVVQMIYLESRDKKTLMRQLLQELSHLGLHYLQDILTFHSTDRHPSFFLFWSGLYVHDGDKIRKEADFIGNTSRFISIDQIEIEGPMKVYHPALFRPRESVNPCEASPCSHLCVHSNSNQGYHCLCPLDMRLAAQGTCQRSDKLRLLTCGLRMSGIYEVPLQFKGLSTLRMRPLVSADVGCFTYGPTNQIIVYHQHNSIEAVNIHHTRNVTVLFSNIPSVEGMALDETTGHVFWSSHTGHIARGQLDGTDQETIINGLQRPRGIVVDTYHRQLYICDWGINARILRCSTDGQTCETFLPVPNGHPNHVTISQVEGSSQNRLIWTDSRLDYIGLLTLDGNGTKEKITLNGTRSILGRSDGYCRSHLIKACSVRNPHPYAISSAANIVFFTDLNSGHIQYFRTDLDETQIHDFALGLGSLQSIAAFRYPHDLYNLVPVQSEADRTTVMPSTMTRLREPDAIPAIREEPPNFVWIVFLFVGTVLAVLVLMAGICYYRNRQRKGWLQGFIRYVKEHPTDDIEHLMAHSASSNPSFQNLEDLDYPELEARRRSRDLRAVHCVREYSTVSMDSAFTEMHDFTNDSVDSVSQ